MMKFLTGLCFLCAMGQLLAASKSQYHLANPTPENLTREFNTERPDKTINPFTLDGGHFQVESDVVNYKEDDEDKKRSIQFFTTLLRLGLTNNTELQTELEAYVQEISHPEATSRQKKEGLGDMVIRLKHNLQGNDHGDFAISLTPIAYLPTAAAGLSPHDRMEGGLAVPMSLKIENLWVLELLTQVDNRNEDSELKWQSNYTNGISLSRPIFEKFVLYVEVFNLYKKNPKLTNETTLDFGLQYELSEEIKLDAGTYLGMSPEAQDQEIFVGTSVQF